MSYETAVSCKKANNIARFLGARYLKELKDTPPYRFR